MYRLTVMAGVLHFVLLSAASAQVVLEPRVVSQLNEVYADANQEWKYYSRESSYPPGCLSEKGLMIISKDSISFRSINENGSINWESRNPDGLEPNFAYCSPDGRYIFLGYKSKIHVKPVQILYETLTSDGQRLWGKTGSRDTSHWITGSSDYIVFYEPYDHYNGIYNITVVDIQSGSEIWSDNLQKKYHYDAPVEWGSDRLVYVSHDSLAVLATHTGELKWRQPIGPIYGSTDSSRAESPRLRLVPSTDGTRLVVSVVRYVEGKRRERVGGFDQYGQMMWLSDNNAGTPLGITPDNKFLVSLVSFKGDNPRKNYHHLKLIDMNTGTVLWTLPGRFRTSGGNWFVFLKDRLFLSFWPPHFRDDLKRGILILNLGSSGQIESQALLWRYGIQSISLRSEAWVSQDSNTQREVFLTIEGGWDWGTYFIESIGH